MVVGTLAGACAGFYCLNVASQNRTVLNKISMIKIGKNESKS